MRDLRANDHAHVRARVNLHRNRDVEVSMSTMTDFLAQGIGINNAGVEPALPE